LHRVDLLPCHEATREWRYSHADLERDLATANATIDALQARLAESERISEVVWRFIDRMNDVCEQDPAEKILAEFVAAFDAARREGQS
jgi:hypothetical protein